MPEGRLMEEMSHGSEQPTLADCVGCWQIPLEETAWHNPIMPGRTFEDVCAER